MRTLVAGTLTVYAYDYAVWKQEKNTLRVVDLSATTCTIYAPTSSAILATYTLDENHEVEIDMSDYIRTHPSSHIYVETKTLYTHRVDAVYITDGLINPKNVIIPHDETLSNILKFDDEYEQIIRGFLYVIPPKMMLVGIASTRLRAEMNEITEVAAQDYDLEISALSGGTWHDVVAFGKYMELPANTIRYRIYEDYIGSFLMDRTLRPLECGKRYAAVRWVSFTGNERIHTWEVTKSKTATRDAIELLTVDGSYNTLKGREDGFVLRLDGLNAYDMWYYADIITSSKVDVSMDGTEWQRVDITTKDITIPDGDAGKLNTLEVNCNWRKYDAITL